MESVFEILYLRRPVLNYVCPPVCEVLFSGTSTPIIVLDPFLPNGAVSGLERGGAGGFQLSWNRYPGAICYSVYQADNADEPFGTYHLIAECIPDATFTLPPGRGPFRVTAITPDGETPPSAPISGGGDGAPVVTVQATTDETQFGSDPGVFTFFRTQPLTNPLIVKYVVTGSADSNVDYEALSGEVVIPAGLSFVDVDVTPFDSAPDTNKTVDVLIVENVNDEYIIGTPSAAEVTILMDEECPQPGDPIPSGFNFIGTYTVPVAGDHITVLGISGKGTVQTVYQTGAAGFDGNPCPGEFKTSNGDHLLVVAGDGNIELWGGNWSCYGMNDTALENDHAGQTLSQHYGGVGEIYFQSIVGTNAFAGANGYPTWSVYFRPDYIGVVCSVDNLSEIAEGLTNPLWTDKVTNVWDGVVGTSSGPSTGTFLDIYTSTNSPNRVSVGGKGMNLAEAYGPQTGQEVVDLLNGECASNPEFCGLADELVAEGAIVLDTLYWVFATQDFYHSPGGEPGYYGWVGIKKYGSGIEGNYRKVYGARETSPACVTLTPV